MNLPEMFLEQYFQICYNFFIKTTHRYQCPCIHQSAQQQPRTAATLARLNFQNSENIVIFHTKVFQTHYSLFIKIFHREQHPCIHQPAQQKHRRAVTLTRLDSPENIFFLYPPSPQVPAAANPAKPAEAKKSANKRSICKVNSSD